jgi:hypothetical protein
MTDCILPNGITGIICIKWLKEMNRTQSDRHGHPDTTRRSMSFVPQDATERPVTIRPPGCHRTSLHHSSPRMPQNVPWPFVPQDATERPVTINFCLSQYGYYFLDVPNSNVRVTVCTSTCGGILQLCLIQIHVSMSSFLFMELMDCHTGTHGHTDCNFHPQVLLWQDQRIFFLIS